MAPSFVGNEKLKKIINQS